MKKILFIALLTAGPAIALEGPDFMLLNQVYTANARYFSLISQPVDGYDFSLVFANASLYGVGYLNWSFFGVRVDYRAASLSLYYRNYGIRDLYDSPIVLSYLQKRIMKYLNLGVGISHRELRYGNTVFRTTKNAMLFGIGIEFAKISICSLIENVELFSNSNDGENAEAHLSANWLVQETLTIYFSVYSDRRHHQRVALGQNLGLSKQLALNAGLLSDPEIFYAGFEFNYREFILGYTYYDAGALPDCSKLTLAYR